MRCTDVRDLLRRGGPLPGIALAHLEQCPACAEAARDPEIGIALAALDLSVGELGGVRASLMAEVSRPPTLRDRLRTSSTRARVGLVGAVAAVLFGAVALGSRRSDLPEYPMVRYGIELLVLGSIVGLAVVTGLRSAATPPSTTRRDRAVGVALILLPFLLAALPSAHEASIADGGTLVTSILGCLGYGGAVGALVLIAMWLVSRGEVGVPLGRPGIAVVGGATGLLLLHVHCPSTDPTHMLFAHASLPALFAAPATFTLLLARPKPSR